MEEVTPELGELAVQATQALGLRSSGVDLLPSTDGPVLLEINGSPGLGGIEKVTGSDVASRWIMSLENRCTEAN